MTGGATAEPRSGDRSTLAMWVDMQRRILGRWLEAEIAERPTEAARRKTGSPGANLADAFSASAKATCWAQADFVRSWAERVAADPRSSKLTVEAAHQIYELALSSTAANAALYESWVAALRTIEPMGLTTTGSSVFRVWRGTLRTCFARRPATTLGTAPIPTESGPR